MSKHGIYTLKSLDVYFLVYELAIKHGKKPGDSMEQEFEEIRQQYPDQFQYIGESEQDADQIIGNLRENGANIFNPHEVDRRNEVKKNED